MPEMASVRKYVNKKYENEDIVVGILDQYLEKVIIMKTRF